MVFGVDLIGTKLVMVAALDADIPCVFREQMFALRNTFIVHSQFAAAIYRHDRDI